MQTCPNCRYQARPGQTSCPMCGTELTGNARPATARLVVAALLVLGLVGLVAAGAVTRRGRTAGGPAASGASARTPAGCRRPVNVRVPAKKTYPAPPTEQLDASRAYRLVLQTTCGEIDVALDVARAPKTTSSVAFLARQGFYDGIPYYQIIPGLVILTGDPTASGRGGPGYSIVEAPPQDLHYDPGVVAMYRAPGEAAGTSGSQFFIISGPGGAELQPDFALVGHVVKGMDVVKRIEGTPAAARKPVLLKARVAEAASPSR